MQKLAPIGLFFISPARTGLIFMKQKITSMTVERSGTPQVFEGLASERDPWAEEEKEEEKDAEVEESEEAEAEADRLREQV